MKGSAPYTSRVTSHTEFFTNAQSPVWASVGPPMRESSAMISAAITSTPSPSTVSTAAQARSGRLARARGDSFSCARAAVISLAGCKDGLSLHRDRLERPLHPLHQRSGERRVVERGGELLSVVLGPPEEVHQRFALLRVCLVFVDKQPGKARDRPGVLAGRVGDRDAVVVGDLRLGRGGRNR